MFVRNNTLCPDCGKSKTFDLFVTQLDSGAPEVFRLCMECIACSRRWCFDLDGFTLGSLIVRVLDTVDYEELSTYLYGLRNAFLSHWNPDGSSGEVSRLAFSRAWHGIFHANRIHKGLFENKVLQEVILYLLLNRKTRKHLSGSNFLRTVSI